MPYILTSQEWLAQSALLIEARPTTARVSTKYNIKPAKARAAKKTAVKKEGGDDDDTPMTDAADAKPPRASLIIKTFDPHSGVCLKYKTTKAAEVSRLVQLLGALGRKMAALPDAPSPAAEDEAAAGPATPPVAAGAASGAASQQAQAGAAGGGGKKKKKGKR